MQEFESSSNIASKIISYSDFRTSINTLLEQYKVQDDYNRMMSLMSGQIFTNNLENEIEISNDISEKYFNKKNKIKVIDLLSFMSENFNKVDINDLKNIHKNIANNIQKKQMLNKVVSGIKFFLGLGLGILSLISLGLGISSLLIPIIVTGAALATTVIPGFIQGVLSIKINEAYEEKVNFFSKNIETNLSLISGNYIDVLKSKDPSFHKIMENFEKTKLENKSLKEENKKENLNIEKEKTIRNSYDIKEKKINSSNPISLNKTINFFWLLYFFF